MAHFMLGMFLSITFYSIKSWGEEANWDCPGSSAFAMICMLGLLSTFQFVNICENKSIQAIEAIDLMNNWSNWGILYAFITGTIWGFILSMKVKINKNKLYNLSKGELD